MNTDENQTAVAVTETAPQGVPAETVSPEQAAAPAVAPKPKKKAKAKKPVTVNKDAMLEEILSLLYDLRNKNKPMWANLRNSTKEGEKLDILLKKTPQYSWKQIGKAWYLMPKHEDTDQCVAYIVVYDPMGEYRRAMEEFHAAIRNTRLKKKPVQPKKPASGKLDYMWRIANRRQKDETEGHSPTLDEAKKAVLRRNSDFLV